MQSFARHETSIHLFSSLYSQNFGWHDVQISRSVMQDSQNKTLQESSSTHLCLSSLTKKSALHTSHLSRPSVMHVSQFETLQTISTQLPV